MNDFLLDTNVISELRRLRPEPAVIQFLDTTDPRKLYVSSVTFAELRFGIELVSDWNIRSEIEDWLTGEIRPMFKNQTLEITEDILVRWRFLTEIGRKVGRTYPNPDLMLAATAMEFGLTLVTRNIRDFEGLGLPVFNPWEV